ncbi:phage tail-collar fiber domain-containing protein [Oceanobacter kriegii]|uniref:phage tail-collar fiber domain-containing protein n=1 Tax=Oceanobacter kriegii TaxID=64972 RepID=UPI0004044217|nr:phage tail protein [Oceanobacter kriegii]
MSMQIVITDAGLAAIIDAQNSGLTLRITEMRVGSGQWNPTSAATALQSEIKPITNISGEETLPGVLRINIVDDSTDAYQAGELGFFDASGTLIALYSQTSGYVTEKASGSALVMALDLTLTTVDPAAISFGSTNFVLPAGTTSKPGVVELAINDEVDAGAQGKVVDALRLQSWFNRTKTDDTETNDSSKLVTAAAAYALQEQVDERGSQIATLNTRLKASTVPSTVMISFLNDALSFPISGRVDLSESMPFARLYQLHTQYGGTIIDGAYQVIVERKATGTYGILYQKYNASTETWTLQNVSGIVCQVTLASFETGKDEFIVDFLSKTTTELTMVIQTENSTLNDCPFYLTVTPQGSVANTATDPVS